MSVCVVGRLVVRLPYNRDKGSEWSPLRDVDIHRVLDCVRDDLRVDVGGIRGNVSMHRHRCRRRRTRSNVRIAICV